MQITRMDLDETGSPEGLVTKILKAEPGLTYPIPIEELAAALDIREIAALETEGFEGGLLMDAHRSAGSILVNRKANGGRRRFTIGHELGHFLIPTHKPVKGDKFLCSREDMRKWTVGERDDYARMEVEANRFAALLLMPPPLLRSYLARLGDPDLRHVLAVHDDFEVSKDAAARAYAQYHEQKIAVVVIHDGKVLRFYKGSAFPALSVTDGSSVPRSSVYWRPRDQSVGGILGIKPSDVTEGQAGDWLRSEWGVALPQLYEQVFHQQSGFALLLLWAEFPDEDDEYDPDEDRTSKERLSRRMERFRR